MAANIQLMLKDTVVMEINFDEVLVKQRKNYDAIIGYLANRAED